MGGPGVAGVVLLHADDDWLARRLTRLGLDVRVPGEAGDDSQPTVVVVDLAGDAALERAREARARWPEAVVAGYLAVPDPTRWKAGQRAGCDVVANRGALVGRLRPILGEGRRRRQVYPLMDEADTAGRLGMVARFDDSPVGPVAVYRVDGALVACADVCPHQGARLSEGELDRGIVTCPRHGSQFDVTSGARTRGPADVDIARYALEVDTGQVVLVLPQDVPADGTSERRAP